MVVKKVRNHVAKFRQQLGITQMALADAAGISVIEEYRVERELHVPTMYTALMICEVLGKELQEVFYVEVTNT